MIILSIIVPIYNVNNILLTESLNSIETSLNQTNYNIETILISDGTTIENLTIIRQYAEKNSWMLIEQENEGVSAARNKGLRLSNGKYIAFIDPDDVISPRYLDRMLHAIIEQKLDLITCNHSINGKIAVTTDELTIFEDNNIFLMKVLGKSKSAQHNISGSPWAKIYKKELITTNDVYFDNELKRSQDILFNLSVGKHLNRWGYIDTQLYDYSLYFGSAMRRYWENSYELSTKLLDKVRMLNDRIIIENIGYLCISKYKDVMQNYNFSFENKSNARKRYQYLKTISLDPNFSEISNIKVNTIFERIMVFSYKHKIFIMLYILFYTKSIIQKLVKRNGH